MKSKSDCGQSHVFVDSSSSVQSALVHSPHPPRFPFPGRQNISNGWDPFWDLLLFSLSLGILPPSQIQAQAGLLEERLSTGKQGTPPYTWLRLPSKTHLMASPCVSSDETAQRRNFQSTPGLSNNQYGSYCNPLNLGVKIDNSQSCNITRKKKKVQDIKLYQLIGSNYKTITTKGNWYM